MGKERMQGGGRSRDGRIPLILGVSGHRDLREQDLPDLAKKVAEVLDELRADYKNTEIVVLSALADGADRLGAETALK